MGPFRVRGPDLLYSTHIVQLGLLGMARMHRISPVSPHCPNSNPHMKNKTQEPNMAAYLSNSLMKRNSHRRRVRGRMAQSLTDDQTPTEEEEMIKRCRAASCCRFSSVCSEYQQLSSSLSQRVSSMSGGCLWGHF